MSRIECTECHDLIDTTARTVVLPFVCDECQKAPELLAAMAPLRIENADNHACDSVTIENTTLLIEDQANQLALALNEVDALRQVNQYLEVREIALVIQIEQLQKAVENQVVKSFFKDEKITKLSQETFGAYFESFMLKIVNSKLVATVQQIRSELSYAALRIFALAIENEQLREERDAFQKRAEIAKRCYDRASADRRYYRGKLKDAGIKA